MKAEIVALLNMLAGLRTVGEGGGEAMTDQTDRLNTALAGRYCIERHLGTGAS